MYFFKTDTDGNKVWEKILGEGECHSTQQTVDGGYIVEGRLGSSLHAYSYLAKFSPES